jgi:phosphoserine phosphatase RsbU/P
MALADGRIYFALADVSGKGMNAALLMAKTTSLLRCLAKHASGVSALLRQVNDELCEQATLGMFVTLIVGYLDPRTGRIELANAGHPPAMLHRPDGSFVELAAQAPPLGVLAAMDFPALEISLDGGGLYLYTDGISESALGTVGELGASGLKRLIAATSTVATELRLGALLRAWRAAGYQARDDVTLLLVEVPAVPADASQCLLALRFAADPGELKRVREQVQQTAGQLGWQTKFVDDVVMAVNEACMNIIEHAYQGDSSGEIELAIHNNENVIEVVLTDFAPPIDIEAIRARDLDELRPGGLGTHFMAALMDSCVYAHLVGSPGNVLRMTKRRPV